MKLKSITFLLLMSTSPLAFCGNWFIGASGGGNVTANTPVGDLPMAREEFGINFYKHSDDAEASDISQRVVREGGDSTAILDAAKHLMSMRLVYQNGLNGGLFAGYQIKKFSMGINWQYIHIAYKQINGVDDNEEQAHPFWSPANMSGKMVINNYLVFAEYYLKQLMFFKLTPVVGIMAGIADEKDVLTAGGNTAERFQTLFAYGFKAGLNYHLTKNLQAKLEAVFFGTGKINATNNYLKQGQLNLGVNWIFN